MQGAQTDRRVRRALHSQGNHQRDGARLSPLRLRDRRPVEEREPPGAPPGPQHRGGGLYWGQVLSGGSSTHSAHLTRWQISQTDE